jgi:phosphoserine phosphatase RsbX
VHENGRYGPIEWATAGRPMGGRVSRHHPIALDIDEDAAPFDAMDGPGHGPAAATAALRAVDALDAIEPAARHRGVST